MHADAGHLVLEHSACACPAPPRSASTPPSLCALTRLGARAAAMREEVRSSAAAPPDPPPGRSASPPPTPVASYAALSSSPFLARPLGVRVATVLAEPSALLSADRLTLASG